jgi:hypothetical protein
MIPRTEYSKVIRASFDEMGHRRPKSSHPFDGEQVAGWSDGDYPLWLQQEMDLYLPEEVLREFGRLVFSVMNGPFCKFHPRTPLA